MRHFFLARFLLQREHAEIEQLNFVEKWFLREGLTIGLVKISILGLGAF